MATSRQPLATLRGKLDALTAAAEGRWTPRAETDLMNFKSRLNGCKAKTIAATRSASTARISQMPFETTLREPPIALVAGPGFIIGIWRGIAQISEGTFEAPGAH